MAKLTYEFSDEMSKYSSINKIEFDIKDDLTIDEMRIVLKEFLCSIGYAEKSVEDIFIDR